MISRWFRRLRPEEGLLVFAFIASAILTVYAERRFVPSRHQFTADPRGPAPARARLGLAGAVPLMERLRRWRNGSPALHATAEFLRTFLPFIMCIAVYTNLHDTVRYVNSHDIHPYLAAAEEWLFGGQPVFWAEAYITPARTEFFNAFYANFYLVAPSVVLILWFAGRRDEARTVLLGVIVCFYTGYLLYVIFPAAPPRLYFASLGLFKVTLTRRADHELSGISDRHDAEPCRARGVPEPALRNQLPQSLLRVEVLPLVLSDPARVRDRPAHVHDLPAPSLGRGSDRRRLPRAVDALVRAALRTVVELAHSSARSSAVTSYTGTRRAGPRR